MDELISIIQLRSAIPFGCLLVVAFGYAYASIRYSENINMNPFFKEPVLVGEWD